MIYQQFCRIIETRLGSSVRDHDVEGIADDAINLDVEGMSEDEWDELIAPHAAEPEHRYPYNPNHF